MGTEAEDARRRGEEITRRAKEIHEQEESTRTGKSGGNKTSDTDNWQTKPPKA